MNWGTCLVIFKSKFFMFFEKNHMVRGYANLSKTSKQLFIKSPVNIGDDLFFRLNDDYSHMTERFERHESQQNELQHYVHMVGNTYQHVFSLP